MVHNSAALRAFADAYNVPSPEAAMRVACSQILQACGAVTPPIPLKRICQHLSIKIVNKQTPGKATLRTTGGAFELWMTPTKTRWRRERFTVAHEISHAILMLALRNAGLIDSLNSDTLTHSELERLCDIGAAEILMPRLLMREALANYGLSEAGLGQIYDMFLVSYRTMLFRIAQVLPSSAMALWRKYAREPEEEAVLRVWSCYPNYRIKVHAPWLPRGLTTRHLIPDVVTDAIENQRSAFVPNVEVHLNGAKECIGFVGMIPRTRKKQSQLPLFDGIVVPDEFEPLIDAFLLLAPKAMAEASDIWAKLKEHN